MVAFVVYALQSMLIQAYLAPLDLMMQIRGLVPLRMHFVGYLSIFILLAFAISIPGASAVRWALEPKSFRKFQPKEAILLWTALVVSVALGGFLKLLFIRGDEISVSIVSPERLMQTLTVVIAVFIVSFPSALVLATGFKWLSPAIARLDYIRLRSLVMSLHGLVDPKATLGVFLKEFSGPQRAALIVKTADSLESEVHMLLSIEDDRKTIKGVLDLLSASLILGESVGIVISNSAYQDLDRLLPAGIYGGVVASEGCRASDDIRRLSVDLEF